MIKKDGNSTTHEFMRLLPLSKLLSLQPHPFRLLLHLEWVLLSLAAFKLFSFPGWGRPVLWSEGQVFSSIGLKPSEVMAFGGLLILFGIMGLRLPTSRWTKWIYLTICFTIITIIAQLQGWGLEALSPLLVIVLLRSSSMFGQNSLWMIAGLVWLVYPFTLFPFLVVWAILRFVPITGGQSDVSIPGLTMLPDGGAQWNISFTPEQVQQFLTYLQNAILYYLADALLSFGLILVFVLLLVNSLIKERQGRRKLVLAHEQLYQYSLQIEDQATWQERTRIAREIHDSLGHLLTAQSIVLENTALLLATNLQEARVFLEDSKRLGAQARQELRQAVLMLRSDPLQGKPFETAIEDLISEFNRVTHLTPTLQMAISVQFPHRYQIAVYRILEEALTNIQKHSEATVVNVELRTHLESEHTPIPILCLQVVDNGKGFDPQQNQTGFGIQGMKERAESLGGHLQIRSESGCSITAQFPLLGATT